MASEGSELRQCPRIVAKGLGVLGGGGGGGGGGRGVRVWWRTVWWRIRSTTKSWVCCVWRGKRWRESNGDGGGRIAVR